MRCVFYDSLDITFFDAKLQVRLAELNKVHKKKSIPFQIISEDDWKKKINGSFFINLNHLWIQSLFERELITIMSSICFLGW